MASALASVSRGRLVMESVPPEDLGLGHRQSSELASSSRGGLGNPELLSARNNGLVKTDSAFVVLFIFLE